MITFVRPVCLVKNFQISIKSLKIEKGEANTWPKTSKCNALSNGTMHRCILGIPPLTLKRERFWKNVVYSVFTNWILFKVPFDFFQHLDPASMSSTDAEVEPLIQDPTLLENALSQISLPHLPSSTIHLQLPPFEQALAYGYKDGLQASPDLARTIQVNLRHIYNYTVPQI